MCSPLIKTLLRGNGERYTPPVVNSCHPYEKSPSSMGWLAFRCHFTEFTEQKCVP